MKFALIAMLVACAALTAAEEIADQNTAADHHDYYRGYGTYPNYGGHGYGHGYGHGPYGAYRGRRSVDDQYTEEQHYAPYSSYPTYSSYPSYSSYGYRPSSYGSYRPYGGYSTYDSYY